MPDTKFVHSPDPKRRYLCRHIFIDGHRCGSPALRGQHFYYYHRRFREQPAAATGYRNDPTIFTIPPIDDPPPSRSPSTRSSPIEDFIFDPLRRPGSSRRTPAHRTCLGWRPRRSPLQRNGTRSFIPPKRRRLRRRLRHPARR